MLALVLSLSAPHPAWAQSLIGIILTDPLTGLAIGGMDPVSYFTDPRPQPGRADYEYIWRGVPWYFANPANLEVFKRNPELYTPQYGGHGAMSMARGFVSDAVPEFYTVFKQRLYLFYSPGNREAFLLSPEEAARTGAKYWQELSKTLTVQ